MKKVLLALLAAAAIAAGYSGVKKYREGLPTLVGHCYGMEDGSALAIVDATDLEDPETGKPTKVYVGIIVVPGLGLQIPTPLDIRKTNVGIPKMVADKHAIEISCETGQPLAK